MRTENSVGTPVRASDSPADPQVARFAQALRMAMARHGMSERRLASELGITIGTTQKYFRFKVHPLKVGTGINRELARLLGITLDGLVSFYETGEFRNAVTFGEVSAWLRSEAGIEHLAPVLEAMSELGKRAGGQGKGCQGSTPPRYEWPAEELAAAKVSPALRERMGLTDEALERLATTGEFDEALVEAFSVAVNLEEDAVREAFRTRTAVG